ncbi:MAG: ShlB/FhaC/HecB family hemolysin secretion/activation protein [Candidatus Omnitrophota bacterium]
MNIKKVTYFVILPCVAFLAGLMPAAFAQPPDIGQITKEVDRPFREEAQKEMQAPPEKPKIVEEEEKKPEAPAVTFFAKKILLEGTESFPPEEFRSLIEKYENKKISINDLSILSDEIEREYLRRGIITACFVPPQEIRDGVVKLQVVEAKMGSLHVNDHKYFDKDMVKFYWTIKQNQILRYDKMSKSLYLMNKNADRTVKATLHAGDKPRTTDVTLDVDTRFPIHPTGSFDNEGTVSSGIARWGVGLRHNNFLFVDDILLLGYSFGKHFLGIYGYHSVPITNFGTSIMYGYSYSQSSPKKEFGSFGLESEARTTSFFVHQDVFQNGSYRGEIYTGFEAKDKNTDIYQGAINRDRLRILTFGSNMIHEYPGAVTYMNPEFTQGINGFGARSRSPLSSRQASNTFSIFNLNINHTRSLPVFDLRAVAKFKGQIASEILPPQEEFSLGGINSVRGYPSGDFLADNAFQVNFEILIPAYFIPEEIKLPFDDRPFKDDITGVVFFDYGYGQKRGKSQTERPDDSLAGVGVGLRIRAMKFGIVRLEWGFPVGNRPITQTAPGRLHVSIDLKY